MSRLHGALAILTVIAAAPLRAQSTTPPIHIQVRDSAGYAAPVVELRIVRAEQIAGSTEMLLDATDVRARAHTSWIGRPNPSRRRPDRHAGANHRHGHRESHFLPDGGSPVRISRPGYDDCPWRRAAAPRVGSALEHHFVV
jgi:hypothetical protein